MKKTTVLLDAGGVLLDERELEQFVCQVVTDLVRTLDSSYSPDQYWTDTTEAILRHCPSTPRAVLWKRCAGEARRYGELLALYTRRMGEGRPALKLYDEMATEVPALARSFRLVLAGQYGPGVYDLLRRHGLEQLFANRLSQDDFTTTKPDPRYIALIAERSGARPDECIMVGDRIDKDVIPAKQNNMGTVFVRTGIYRIQSPRTPEEAPDITLDGLAGLADRAIVAWGR
jgi:FMN phosphatase YigB (HAD superfamily)